jgi:predicted amino acid-binding ACT domain protein
LKLRHNLDAMHIEKNICDNILGILMNIPKKTKDTANVQRDLREIGIYKELHLQINGATTMMPVAVYTLTGDEKN